MHSFGHMIFPSVRHYPASFLSLSVDCHREKMPEKNALPRHKNKVISNLTSIHFVQKKAKVFTHALMIRG